MNAKREEVEKVYSDLIKDIKSLRSILGLDKDIDNLLVEIEDNDLKTSIDICTARLKRVRNISKM